MSEQRHSDDGVERRAGSRRLVEELVEARRQVLVRFEQAAGVSPFPAGASPAGALEQFNQVLTDYVASGHFALYQRIAEGQERRRGISVLAADLYPRIVATTEALMAFSDGLARRGEERVQQEMAMVGEQLAIRAGLEDQLLEAMLRD